LNIFILKHPKPITKQTVMNINTSLKSDILHKLGTEPIVLSSKLNLFTSDFLYDTVHAAGHDLRSPLFVIRSYGHLLQKTQEKDRLKRGFQLIEEATFKMEKTINDFVGLMDIYTVPFPPKQMVSLQAAFESAKVELVNLISKCQPLISFDFDDFPQVYFTIKHLKDIMIYLIDNAMRHNQENKNLEIKIKSEKVENGIALIVEDNGKGINDIDEQNKVKNPFYKYTDNPDCIGIGLAKVQAIAQVSESSFELESKLNNGLACHFVFAS